MGMKYKILPYEKRLANKLPPMSTAQIDYLKWKYRHALVLTLSAFRDTRKGLDIEDVLYEIFYYLFHDSERYKMTTIQSFEGWLIKELEKMITKEDKCGIWSEIRKEIICDRIYRSRFFDNISDKYFNQCVEILICAGVSNPVLFSISAFEDVENFHISFEEDELQFVKELNTALNLFCNKEARPKINLKVIKPLLAISVNT
jgi:hypothetical protein